MVSAGPLGCGTVMYAQGGGCGDACACEGGGDGVGGWTTIVGVAGTGFAGRIGEAVGISRFVRLAAGSVVDIASLLDIELLCRLDPRGSSVSAEGGVISSTARIFLDVGLEYGFLGSFP